MQGFATQAPESFPRRALNDPAVAFEFLSLERDDDREQRRIVMDLTISIPDIDLFTRSFRAFKPEPSHRSASVSGSVAIGHDRYLVPGHASRVEFQFDPEQDSRQRAHEPRQLSRLYMSIDLYAKQGDAAPQKRLRGYKFFHDDPGHDVWIDLATMFFLVYDIEHDAIESAGVARISLSEFLSKQLGTYDVSNSEGAFGPDESVRVWALLRFAGAMFGGIRNVYDRWY
jgi:hypothetical protein